MKTSTQKLINFAKNYQCYFYLALISMFIGGLTAIFPSWLIKIAIDGLAAIENNLSKFNILPSQAQDFLSSNSIDISLFAIDPKNLLSFLPLSIIAVSILDASFKFLYQYNSRKLGLLTVKNIREKYHQHINLLSIQEQRKHDSGSLVSVISSDLNSMQSWLAESTMNLFSESFKAIFLFSWLLIIDWKLTAFSLVAIPLFAIPVLKLGKGIRNYAKKGQDYIGNVASFAAETIKNQNIIKVFNLETWREDEFKKESDELYNLQHKWVLLMAAVSPLTNIIGALGVAAILYFGLQAVRASGLSVGEFSSFFVTSILLYDPIKRLGRVTTIIQSALGVADRVFSILDKAVQDDNQTNPSFKKIDINGAIEFKNLSFSYEDEKVFKNLNLSIPAKTSLALVGPSGSGKSTLVSLIPRFYEAGFGEILLDGVNIRNFSLEDLRKNIALVSQEPLLFNASIRKNIALGIDQKNLSTEEKNKLIERAARESFVLDFAMNLEKGLDTQVGEAGSKLSIGQKQRISLARAFASTARIIILDEPTSALDNESQEFVYKSIENLMHERTVIIIAHRLHTIKACDRIVFLEDGNIIEQGSHEELLQKGSSYSQLYSTNIN